jgi:hypothetical protein
MYYVNNFPKHRIPIMWLGCLICTFSAIGAGFAKTVCRHLKLHMIQLGLTVITATATDHVDRTVVRYWGGHAVWSVHSFDG